MKQPYSVDLINFVASLVFGSEMNQITEETAAIDIKEWAAEGYDLPHDMTPEAYAYLWNSFCGIDDKK
jgi:hypothetical protein